jgi:hypothetical protein
MKKIVAFLPLFFFVITSNISSIPTDEKIQQYALELGIPFMELKALVDKHHNNENYDFQNPLAKNALPLEVDELEFLTASKRLDTNKIYRIKCYFDFVKGDKLFIHKGKRAGNDIPIIINSMVRFRQGQPLEVLLKCENLSYGIELIAIEIIERTTL